MFHKKMQKIFDIFKKDIDDDESNYFTEINNNIQIFDYLNYVSFCYDVSKEKDSIVSFSFYWGCPPTFAGYLMQLLIKNKIDDIEMMENIYPNFDECGDYQGMLFGEAGYEKYEEMIYKKVRYKKYKNFEAKEETKNTTELEKGGK